MQHKCVTFFLLTSLLLVHVSDVAIRIKVTSTVYHWQTDTVFYKTRLKELELLWNLGFWQASTTSFTISIWQCCMSNTLDLTFVKTWKRRIYLATWVWSQPCCLVKCNVSSAGFYIFETIKKNMKILVSFSINRLCFHVWTK